MVNSLSVNFNFQITLFLFPKIRIHFQFRSLYLFLIPHRKIKKSTKIVTLEIFKTSCFVILRYCLQQKCQLAPNYHSLKSPKSVRLLILTWFFSLENIPNCRVLLSMWSFQKAILFFIELRGMDFNQNTCQVSERFGQEVRSNQLLNTFLFLYLYSVHLQSSIYEVCPKMTQLFNIEVL